MTERETSIAHQALSNLARRLFAFIEREVTAAGTPGEFVAISGRAFDKAGFRSGSIRAGAVREVECVGLIEKRMASRRANEFRLSEKWREITDADAARAATAAAREPTRKMEQHREHVRRTTRKPRPEQIAVPIERAPPRPVSLWQIPWPSNPDAGL